MTEIKFFISKDFMGYPTGILKGLYKNSVNIEGSLQLPRKLNNKTLSFNNLEEILNYRVCCCHKKVCSYNEELYRLVEQFKTFFPNA